MKKIYSLMVAALMSVAMLAGENDLLWDYTEVAPSANPDNGLYYDSKVNDAAGTKNGLKGIKMNGSGYCYFTKAAVAGKLKLTFGPRDGAKETSLEVFTWAGETPAAETSIAVTGTQTESGTQIIELSAAQNNIYIQRKLSVETVLQKIEFTENVDRSFVDFKIEFRDNPYTVLLPENGELPAGVTVEGTNYNGGQHGIYGGTVTVPVDGPVKFTIGACQYSDTPISVKKNGTDFTTVDNKAACGKTAGSFAQNVTYIYTGDAATLTFGFAGNTYVPYFFAEATDITPCEVIFKDQNGTILGKIETYEGATLTMLPYGVEDLPAIAEGDAFRGWFYTNGKKAQAGDPVNGNTTIQAKVTPIETATVGSVQTYDFSSPIFYPEDHETVTTANGAFHDGTHGWYFAADGSVKVQVAGNAVIIAELCTYSESGTVTISNNAGWTVSQQVVKQETADGTQLTAQYEGEAAWLTISWDAKQYIHRVVVYNVEDFLKKDESTGYIMIPEGDAASFILALVQAGEGDKIFLPNGIYDLGETVLTTVSKNNVAIIGQSMTGVVIKNAPDAKTESIDKTATLRIAKNVSGTYLQDLTIQNALDYYKNDDGRAVALWDQGTRTVCKNVRLLSYQDTYYSNLPGAVKYFDECEIHGTVDFICGDGSVYFKNNLLYAEKRKKTGGGSDALTANNGPATDKGYVFESCTLMSECPVISFGRAWNNTPQVAFLNTLVDYSAGEFSFTDGSKIERWTKELMNANAWPKFGEYNTYLADGTVLTPASNEVTFVDPKSGNATQNIQTVLTVDQAAAFTMEYTLGEWAATAAQDAAQAVANPKAIDADATYLVEDNGAFVALLKGSELTDAYLGKTIRQANGRGGFGEAVVNDPTSAVIENADGQQSAVSVQKVIRNGKMIIIRGGVEYNSLGQTIQ